MKITSFLTIIVAAGLFLAVNVLSGTAVQNARLDLTENGLYTLSQGSRNIAANIQEPIRLKLYFSAKAANTNPTFKTYGQRVKELLEEYARRSNGKIKLEVIDPEEFSEEEDAAAAAGLYGIPTSQNGPRLFFGLVGTNATDQTEIIPFFDNTKEQFLEYDLSKLIYTLNNTKKRTVGLMSGLDIDGMSFDPMTRRPQPTQPWQIVHQMRQFYTVKKVESNATSIPDDVDVLVVIHPKNFTESAIYAIDQYVMKGGRLIAFVDPNCEADMPQGRDPLAGVKWEKKSSLNRITDAWGVTVPNDKVVTDSIAGLMLNGGDQQRPELMSFVHYLGLRKKTKDDNEDAPEYFDAADPVVGTLNGVVILTSGVIETKPEATVKVAPLMRTSSSSQLIDQQRVQFYPQPKELLRDFRSENKPYTLAARITGPAKSAFGAKPAPPPAREGEAAPAEIPGEFIAQSKGPISVILCADVDMLSDRTWIQEDRLMGQILLGYRKTADNGDFLLGCLDNFIGSQDLISVRARGEFARPFTVVDNLIKAAKERSGARNQATEAKIKEAEEKLKQIQAQGPQTNVLVRTPEVEAEVKKLNDELLKARKEQRSIQRDLNQDVEKLGTKIKIVNIAAVPVLVCVFALGLGAFRAARRRAAVAKR